MPFAPGNRNTKHFAKPDRPDIGRAKSSHLAFGTGVPHVCLVNEVAQLQVWVLLEKLVKTRGPGRVSLLRSNLTHGVKALDIAFQSVERQWTCHDKQPGRSR